MFAPAILAWRLDFFWLAGFFSGWIFSGWLDFWLDFFWLAGPLAGFFLAGWTSSGWLDFFLDTQTSILWDYSFLPWLPSRDIT